MKKRILGGMIEDARKLNPIDEVQKISPRPLLVVTGDADKEIKLEGVRRFYDLAKEPKELVVIEGADHELSNPLAFEKTMIAVVNWFTREKPKQ